MFVIVAGLLLVFCGVWGFVCLDYATEHDLKNGFLVGFFMGPLGLMFLAIVTVRRAIEKQSPPNRN